MTKFCPWRFEVIATGALLLLISLLSFGGTPDQYFESYLYLLAPERFPANDYLRLSFIANASVVMDLLEMLGLTRDLPTVIWSLVCAALAIIAIDRLVVVIAPGLGLGERCAILVISAFLSHRILTSAWSGPIPVHAGSPSMFGDALGLVTVALLARGRWVVAAAAMTATLAIAVKANFLLLPIAILAILLDRATKKRWLAVLLLPLGLVALRAVTGPALSVEDARTVMPLVFQWEAVDSDWAAQPLGALLLFAVAMIATPLLARGLSARPRALVFAVWLASGLTIAGSLLYQHLLWPLLPSPLFVVVGPIRAMKFVILIFALVAAARVLAEPRLSTPQKAAALMLLPLMQGKGMGLALLALAGSSAVALRWLPLERLRSVPVFALILPAAVLLFGLQLIRGGVYYTVFDDGAFRHLGRWTTAINAAEGTWVDFERLRERPDFPILAFYRDRAGTLRPAAVLALSGGKSPYWSPHAWHAYYSPKLWRLHLERQPVYEAVKSTATTCAPLPPIAATALAAAGARVFVPNDLAGCFGPLQQETIGGHTLVSVEGR